MKNGRRGSALIEFAGSLLLLGTVFAGVFQIGYTFFAYNTLVNAVRAGARYASLQTGRASSGNADLAKAVQNLVVYGDLVPDAGAKSIVPGLATSNVDLTFGPATATVSVRGFKLDSVFSQVNLDGRPAVTFPLATGAAK